MVQTSECPGLSQNGAGDYACRLRAFTVITVVIEAISSENHRMPLLMLTESVPRYLMSLSSWLFTCFFIFLR